MSGIKTRFTTRKTSKFQAWDGGSIGVASGIGPPTPSFSPPPPFIPLWDGFQLGPAVGAPPSPINPLVITPFEGVAGLIFVTHNNNPPSVTDSHGNTYNLIASSTFTGLTFDITQSWFLCSSWAGGAPTSITITPSGPLGTDICLPVLFQLLDIASLDQGPVGSGIGDDAQIIGPSISGAKSDQLYIWAGVNCIDNPPSWSTLSFGVKGGDYTSPPAFFPSLLAALDGIGSSQWDVTKNFATVGSIMEADSVNNCHDNRGPGSGITDGFSCLTFTVKRGL